MELISTVEENGYIINTYSNGTTEKFPKPTNIEEPPQITPQPTQQEIINAQILNKLDYLECITELSSMKGGNL